MKQRLAVAYFRTSSAANVGEEKDSLSRQQQAVEAYAKRQGIQIVKAYYDPAVSGADLIEARAGFASLLEEIPDTGADAVLVENASRFARELLVQLLGHGKLKEMGLSLVPVDAPQHFEADDPTSVMFRNIVGSFVEYEKATLVARLASGREKKKRLTGKCGGRKSVAEIAPEAVKLAKQLRRQNPKTGKRMSYRQIAVRLKEKGYGTETGNPYSASMVQRMI